MDATCAIQASIHVFSLVRKYVSRILGTYHSRAGDFVCLVALPSPEGEGGPAGPDEGLACCGCP